MQWWCAASGVPWTWEWQAYPGVWAFIIALGFGFTRLQARFGSEEDGRRHGFFWAALLVLWIALDWPVGALGAGYLASVHMVQYLLIALVAPPLILAALPRGLYRAMMESRWALPVRVWSQPLVSISFFVAIMAWTHWPPVVDELMVNQFGSFFLDLIWLISGLVFWWPVVAPVPHRRWLGDPFRVGYLIAATLVNTGVFAYLTFSPLPLYATYELAPPVTGLSSRDDQLLAGLFMKMGGAVIIWTAISIIFFRWVNREVSRDGRDHSATTAVVLLALVGLAGCTADAPATDRAPELSGDFAVVEVEEGPEVRPYVERGVVGEPPIPGRAAAYVHLANPGPVPVEIVGVEVLGATSASLHRSSTDGGTMSMEPLAAIEIPVGRSLRMRPGGIHVMFEADSTFFAQQNAKVTLLAADGTRFAVWAPFVELGRLETLLGAGDGSD